MQRNKQREELHRLQERHPKEAAKAAQRVSAQQPTEEEEASSEEDEVCNDLHSDQQGLAQCILALGPPLLM